MDEVLEYAPCGYLVVGDDGCVRESNHTLIEMVGARRDAIVHAHVDKLLTAPSRIFFQTHVFPMLKLQGAVQEVYLSFRGSTGGEVPVLLNARRRPDGDSFASDWIVVPMHQRHEIENEILKARRVAEQAARTKDDFLSLVSHELRSPLSGILGWAQLLSTGKLDEATTERALRAIVRGTRLQSKLVDDILDVGRMATGKVRVEVVALDPAPLLEEALEGIEPAAQAKGVRVIPHIDRGAGLITGDPERLQQVLANLLGNAIKFTPRGGKIEVRLTRAGSSIEVAVADTGVGITREFLPYVFDSFRQAADDPGRRDGGLGLGMSIARHIVELHGGTLTAASPGANQGSTFTLKLPLRIGQDAPANGVRSQEASALGHFTTPAGMVLKGLDLLVVEDEPESRDLLQAILQDSGAGVRHAANVTEALRQYEARRPDLLLSDIEMEGGDGYALVRRIREKESGGTTMTPAIALTGHSRAADRIRALNAGFQMHIPKPVHPAELVAAVANMAAVRAPSGR